MTSVVQQAQARGAASAASSAGARSSDPPIASLPDDPAVKQIARGEPLPGLTRDYVQRRARALIDLDYESVKAMVLREIPQVRARHAEIARRVAADRSHMDVSSPAIYRRVSSRPPGGAKAMRKNLVRTIVHQAGAADPSLVDAANIERLHMLCDRRLRIVERMLYDVGRADHAVWNEAQIRQTPGGPWPDGLDRIFEYPRVRQRVQVFVDNCQPDPATGACRNPMHEWRRVGTDFLVGPERTNAVTTKAWRPAAPPKDPRALLYTKGQAPDIPNAVTAVEQLFAPSDDYLKRNLLFCEQTLHTLHLESLVFSRRKRNVPDSWLDAEADAKPPGWLRIYVPQSRSEPFLAGFREPAHFDQQAVRVSDVQPGDHVVVYNHRAYRYATVAGVWQLEHALVVQTFPRILLQGHGTAILRMTHMQALMAGYFNRELDQRRAEVDGLATVTALVAPTDPAPGRPPLGRVEVDSLEHLRTGTPVEIADPATDAVVATGRKVTAIDPKTRVVTYDGAPATARVGLVLRRPREVVDGFDQITIIAGRVVMRRKVPPATEPRLTGRDRRGEWHLSWQGDTEEHLLRTDTNPATREATAARRAFILEKQHIEYTAVDPDHDEAGTRGWFPLWTRARKGERVHEGGRIMKTKPVSVAKDEIAGWTWFAEDTPEARLRVAAVRPREP